MNTELDTG